MGVGSAKRAAASRDSSVATRHSTSKALKASESPSPPKKISPNKRTSPSKLKNGDPTEFTSRVPEGEDKGRNGRVLGRNLIIWSRPRMAEKLLLMVQYECARHRIDLPWKAIAHRLHPGSTGEALTQHLGRLRKDLTAEGHLVPPLYSKPKKGEAIDPEIRGFVRADTEHGNRDAVRPVYFNEYMGDRKFNLPDALDADDDDEDEEFIEIDEEMEVSPTPESRTQRPAQPNFTSESLPYYNQDMANSEEVQLAAPFTYFQGKHPQVPDQTSPASEPGGHLNFTYQNNPHQVMQPHSFIGPQRQYLPGVSPPSHAPHAYGYGSFGFAPHMHSYPHDPTLKTESVGLEDVLSTTPIRAQEPRGRTVSPEGTLCAGPETPSPRNSVNDTHSVRMSVEQAGWHPMPQMALFQDFATSFESRGTVSSSAVFETSFESRGTVSSSSSFDDDFARGRDAMSTPFF